MCGDVKASPSLDGACRVSAAGRCCRPEQHAGPAMLHAAPATASEHALWGSVCSCCLWDLHWDPLVANSWLRRGSPHLLHAAAKQPSQPQNSRRCLPAVQAPAQSTHTQRHAPAGQHRSDQISPGQALTHTTLRQQPSLCNHTRCSAEPAPLRRSPTSSGCTRTRSSTTASSPRRWAPRPRSSA